VCYDFSGDIRQLYLAPTCSGSFYEYAMLWYGTAQKYRGLIAVVNPLMPKPIGMLIDYAATLTVKRELRSVCHCLGLCDPVTSETTLKCS